MAVGTDEHGVAVAEAVPALHVSAHVEDVAADDEDLDRRVRRGGRITPGVTVRADEQGQPALEQVEGRASLPGVGDPRVRGPRARRGDDDGTVLGDRGGSGGLDSARGVHDAEVVAQVGAPIRANASSDARALCSPTG